MIRRRSDRLNSKQVGGADADGHAGLAMAGQTGRYRMSWLRRNPACDSSGVQRRGVGMGEAGEQLALDLRPSR